MPTEVLTEYERQRLAHVARNREYMARLGVTTMAAKIGLGVDTTATNATMTRPKKIKIKKEHSEPTRRSSRVVGIKAEFTGDEIDDLDEDDADDDARGATKRKRSSVYSDDDHVAASREWLAEARETLLKLRSESSSSGGAKSDSWRDDAVKRWGEHVPKLDAVKDWEEWVKSRVGSPPPASDLCLLQEYYAHDGWMLLMACVLMSRVSSWETKHRCISGFFEAYPTPSAALDARAEDVFEIIKSLGLFPGRMRSIVEVTTKFLTYPGAFTVGLEPEHKLYGIGEFGNDSFHIFARNDISRTPGDKNLQSFVAWQRRRQQKPCVA